MTDVETPPRKRRPMSKADKAKRRAACRRAAEVRALTEARLSHEREKNRAHYLRQLELHGRGYIEKRRRRQIELHGIEGVRERRRRWMRNHRRNKYGVRIRPTFATLGPETMAAIDAAQGNLRKAWQALGIERSAMMRRIAECTVPAGDGTESLRAWLDRTWPQRGGHRAVDVTSVTVEGTGLERVRVYALACGHVKRVAAVGVVRARVVCQQCKEEEKSE